MEPVQNSLQQFLQDERIIEKVAHQIDEVLEHPLCIRWMEEHPQWTQEMLSVFASKLQQYVREQTNCTGCKGLFACTNLMKGHRAELIEIGGMLEVSFTTCSYQEQADLELRRSQMIQSHHIPLEIMQGTFRQFELTNERADAFTAVLDFCKNVQPGKQVTGQSDSSQSETMSHANANGRGIFLYGPLGSGKSYLLGAACNKLAERGISSLMVYTPEFFREMKGAIADQTVEQKIEALQKIPVLIFDDIGAETISAWARDDILGPILQYRVSQCLPTLFTSNYDYDQLEAHLAYTQRAGIERIEELKAKRIMERIRHYTDAYHVGGRNRRTAIR